LSIRQERIANIFQEEISKIISEEVKDEKIKLASITHVDVSSDLSYAKVYFSTLNEENKNDILKSLDKASGFIRSRLCDRVDNLRHIPELTFLYDESIAYGIKIEDIIDKINEENN